MFLLFRWMVLRCRSSGLEGRGIELREREGEKEEEEKKGYKNAIEA